MAKARKRLALATALSLMAISANFLGVSHAGDHDWIQNNPGYRRADGIHCCSSEHCKPKPQDFVKEVQSGWLVPSTGQVFRDGDKGLYYSERQQPYACQRPDGKVECLFVLPGGA